MRPNSILLLFCALFAAADSVNPCDRSLITGVTAEEVIFNVTTKTLSCKDGPDSLMAIEFNSELYDALKCNETDGWMDGFPYNTSLHEYEFLASASSPIAVKCVEYCAFKGRGIFSRKTNSNNAKYLTVFCEGNQQFMFDDRMNRDHYCFLLDWLRLKKDGEVSTPEQLECKRGCTLGNRADISMSLSPVNAAKTRFQCNKGEVNGTKYGVSVNGKVHPYLECDSTDGFVDETDRYIGYSFATIDMECEILPEPKATTTTEPEPEPPAPAPPAPKTPSNEEHTSDDEDTNKAMVIIGCMAAALFIVIILIVIMCIKRRRDEEEERKREEKHHRKREERKKEDRRREEESRTETEDVSEEV